VRDPVGRPGGGGKHHGRANAGVLPLGAGGTIVVQVNQGANTLTIAAADATGPAGPTGPAGATGATGSMVWGPTGDTTRIGAGYTEIAPTPINYWTPTTTVGAPSVRAYDTAVWTGSGMTVWGGFDGSANLNDGGQWRAVSLYLKN
jgi:hypothetical protein